MTDNGYCYAYRNSWTHPAFNNLREAAIWNFLYQNAFWEDGERNFNGHTFSLKRGQIVVSISFLAKGFGMTEKGVRVVIQKLIKLGMLGKQGASKGTILTICNYDKFQDSKKTKGEQGGKRGASGGRAEGDNKKELSKEGTKVNNLYRPDNISDQTWEDFEDLRKRKRAPITKTAMKLIAKQADLAGYSIEDVLQECCARGWVSFKAEWINNNGKQNGKQFNKNQQPSVHDNFTAGINLMLAENSEQH